ncbi:RES family NAD+ phosphorylase [Rhizobium sp. 768_B6_N1_8]|uniref:RES family NAD+ phosphorylase n=1 Tax=unclassified Rhizobium TaxID=2613769 RepID=UPI003F295730
MSDLTIAEESAEPVEATFRPDDLIGPFLPVTRHDIDWFNNFVAEEVDSGYTSSICCCDACYDDFKRFWPGVAFRDMEFEMHSMGLSGFIDYSRLVEIYSPAELSTLRHFVECPRCFANIAGNIWLYDHRFSGADDLEEAIEELTALGRQTPFLLLEHQLAQRLLDAIRLHASTVTAMRVPGLFYRARSAESMVEHAQSPDEPQSYGSAPREYVTEGRFNHSASPMLYLANSAETALREIGEPEKDFNIAALAIDQPLRIFDLVDIDEDLPAYELFTAIANSALLAAPRTGKGWLKQEYVFSRFVADCARSVGFDAIRYGSTKDPEGWNYVLLEPADGALRLVGWHTLRLDLLIGRPPALARL